MLLFHGSNMAVENPKIITSEFGRDFGSGFYTTDIKEQSARWAKRTARIKSNQDNKAKAIISIYEFDEQNFQLLKVKNFPKPATEWLDMVCACRSNINYKHEYDVVMGKIVNDNVGETISFVVGGIMRRQDALERLKFEKINNQICFNAQKALLFLKYVAIEET